MKTARRRRQMQALLDVITWVASLSFAMLLRAEFALDAVPWAAVFVAAAIAGVLQLGYGTFAHLYRGRYGYGSFEEVLGVSLVGAAVAVSLEIVALESTPRLLPASRPIMAGILAISLMMCLRYWIRFGTELRRRPAADAEKIIVLGAGNAGTQLVKAIQNNPRSPYRVVGILDDDPTKRNLRIVGVPVSGTRADLARVAAESGAGVVVAALPQATAATLRDLNRHALELGMKVKVVPALLDLPDGKVGVFHIRDINEEDLLGRSAVHTDLTEIGQFLHGKRVLITGRRRIDRLRAGPPGVRLRACRPRVCSTATRTAYTPRS